MRATQIFGKTLREDPAEADSIGHRLLIKAGLVQQLTAGVYSYMPLALRAIHKIEKIVREEMDAAGGQEVQMPVLQPVELWRASGREQAFGQTLFHLLDRRERTLVLGPTHEEVITDLVRRNVRSYRDLPLLLYQIQTKLRDEARPRAGLIRVREFGMKDAYSFHAQPASLDEGYDRVVQAYKNIFQRCGLPVLVVEADSGAIGGKDSQEFMLIAESGEDEVIRCSSCDYAANLEKAKSRTRPLPAEEPRSLEEVATPGITSIPDLARFLGIPEAKTVKAVFYTCDGQPVFVSIRGDLEVNETKLKNFLKCQELRLSTEEEVRAAGLTAGYASPIGLKGIRRIADDSITLGSNFVVGANKPDTHLRNANYPRDFQVDDMLDIAKAAEGHECQRCGHPLRSTRGIEVGHVFKLGTVFTEAFGATFLDKDGVERPVIMGCYGIGIGRLLGAVVEQSHDDKGIVFPASVSPYSTYLVALNVDRQDVRRAAEELYDRLQAAGIDTLYDDREETAGVKFNDADLLGFPLRLTVSPRTIREGKVEFKSRTAAKPQMVPLEGAVEAARALLGGPTA
ncbi:MAG: proline--tRNA ligase [Chloroflexi bacterium]|nr:proline--tRNA ligase [Chloroflexota bacterium]